MNIILKSTADFGEFGLAGRDPQHVLDDLTVLLGTRDEQELGIEDVYLERLEQLRDIAADMDDADERPSGPAACG